MASQLNIKDAEVIRLARAEAARSGQSMTAVIRQALEQTARAREADIAARWAKVEEITAAFRAEMPAEWRRMTANQILQEFRDEDESGT